MAVMGYSKKMSNTKAKVAPFIPKRVQTEAFVKLTLIMQKKWIRGELIFAPLDFALVLTSARWQRSQRSTYVGGDVTTMKI